MFKKSTTPSARLRALRAERRSRQQMPESESEGLIEAAVRCYRAGGHIVGCAREAAESVYPRNGVARDGLMRHILSVLGRRGGRAARRNSPW